MAPEAAQLVEPHGSAVAPPQPDRRAFRPELTPTWLAAAVLLAGQEPPRLVGRFRMEWWGCTSMLTPLVIAALHPEAQITLWDRDPSSLARADAATTRVGLHNVEVHRHPSPPVVSTDPGTDVVVIDELIDSESDDVTAQMIAAAGALLRPAGLLVLTYRTKVGWSEVAPLVNLLQHLATRTSKHPDDSTSDAMVLLELLVERNAPLLTARPVAAAWLDELLRTDPATVMDRYVRRGMRPRSHAEVCTMAACIGASFVGHADCTDPLDGLSGPLAEQVQAAPSPLLTEVLSDLAVRRDRRADVFRIGELRLSAQDRLDQALRLQVVSTAAGVTALEATAAERSGERGEEPVEELRQALRTGSLHPVAADTPTMSPDHSAAVAAIAALDGIRIATAIGSALPDEMVLTLSESQRAGLGLVELA